MRCMPRERRTLARYALVATLAGSPNGSCVSALVSGGFLPQTKAIIDASKHAMPGMRRIQRMHGGGAGTNLWRLHASAVTGKAYRSTPRRTLPLVMFAHLTETNVRRTHFIVFRTLRTHGTHAERIEQHACTKIARVSGYRSATVDIIRQ